MKPYQIQGTQKQRVELLHVCSSLAQRGWHDTGMMVEFLVVRMGLKRRTAKKVLRGEITPELAA